MYPSFLFPFLSYLSYPFFPHSFFSSLFCIPPSFFSILFLFLYSFLPSFLPSPPTCLLFIYTFSFNLLPSFNFLLYYCYYAPFLPSFLSFFLPSFLPPLPFHSLSFFIPLFHILPFRSMSHRHRGWSFCRSKKVQPPQIPSIQSDTGAMRKRENLYCIYWKASWEAASQLSWDALKGRCKKLSWTSDGLYIKVNGKDSSLKCFIFLLLLFSRLPVGKRLKQAVRVKWWWVAEEREKERERSTSHPLSNYWHFKGRKHVLKLNTWVQIPFVFSFSSAFILHKYIHDSIVSIVHSV